MALVRKLKGKWDSIPLTVKVSTSYAVCSILQKCLSFITLPLFTRLLTKAQYGQYTIYTSWSGILTIFLTLNLAYGSFSTAMVKFEDRRDRYISSIQGITLALSAGFLLIYLPLQGMWNGLFELPTPIILLMVAEIITHTSILLWNGKKRFEFKYKSVIALTLSSAVLSPALAYILVIFNDEKGYARIFGYALVTVTLGGALFILNTVRGKALFDKEFWKYAFKFNIPLIAYYLSQVVFNQSDRIMISHITGTADAAAYGVAYNLAMVLNFALNSINNSYVPWYYGKIKEGKSSENRPVANVIAIIMAILLLEVIWFAPEIITIMAGEKYAPAIGVVAPVAMSLFLLFYSQLFINVEFYYEKKRALVFASILSAVANIALNAWLIPIFGFVAAGYTTLFSYLLFAGGNCIAMKRILKKDGIKDDAYNYKHLLLIMLGFFAASALGMVFYGLLIARIAIFVISAVVIIIFRKKLINTFKLIKKKG